MSMIDSRNPLLIPDLLCDILDLFSPIIPFERYTLVALSQTCLTLSEPSLDRLWRRLPSLKPLVQCYMTTFDEDNTTPPTSAESAIMSRYSHRVRELIISDEFSYRFLKCTNMLPSVLLPNLMVLQWGALCVDAPDIPIVFIRRLLSPTLVSLNAILVEADRETLLSFFDTYPRLCRNLKSIEFRFRAGLHFETCIQALSGAICCHESLEKAVIHGPINEAAFKHLYTSPTLKVLSVHLSPKSAPLGDTFPFADSVFRRAEDLEFTIWDLDLVSSLLRTHDQTFCALRLRHNGRQTSANLHTFLKLLVSRSRANPLHVLSLAFGDIQNPIPPDQMASEAMRYRLSYNTLQPLMALGSLRELVIDWGEQVSLDDDELVNLASSWPSLRYLHIYCGRGGYPPHSTKYATLRGLLSIVHACPELETLALPIDARKIPEVGETEARETKFEVLVVSESPIDQAFPVAEFLFKYLPHVTGIDAKFLRPPGTDTAQLLAYGHEWEQVEVHLAELHFPGIVDSVFSDPDFDSDADSEGAATSEDESSGYEE